MAAAVYQSPGVITVEERPVPQPGPDESCRPGALVRHLRVRHPPTARRVGTATGGGRGARMERDDRRRRRQRHQLVGGRARGRRLLTALRHVPALPGGQAVAVREPQRHDEQPQRRCLRRVHPVPGCRCPAPPRRPGAAPRGTGRAALGGHARHHALGRAARRHRDGVRGRPHRGIERCRPARHGHRRRHRGRAESGTARAGRQTRRQGGRGPVRSRGLPLVGAGAPVVEGRPRRPGVLGSPGRPRGRLLPGRLAVASSSWWAPASTTRPSTSTG